MARIKKIVVFSSIILIVGWISFQIYYFFTFGFGAGSYPHAQVYHFKASEGEVIAAIRELQKENILHKPPGIVNNISVRDTTSQYTDYWRYTNFYYQDSKEVVHAWTRPNDSTSTTFAFYGIDNKIVNQDYWYVTNVFKLRKFRKEIFEPLQNKIAEMETNRISN
jgi:hypothetical protein